MSIELNTHVEKVYEDVPFEVRREWLNLQGKEVTVMLKVRVGGVGAKGMVLHARDIYGGDQSFAIPIEEVTRVEPDDAAA